MPRWRHVQSSLPFCLPCSPHQLGRCVFLHSLPAEIASTLPKDLQLISIWLACRKVPLVTCHAPHPLTLCPPTREARATQTTLPLTWTWGQARAIATLGSSPSTREGQCPPKAQGAYRSHSSRSACVKTSLASASCSASVMCNTKRGAGRRRPPFPHQPLPVQRPQIHFLFWDAGVGERVYSRHTGVQQARHRRDGNCIPSRWVKKGNRQARSRNMSSFKASQNRNTTL